MQNSVNTLLIVFVISIVVVNFLILRSVSKKVIEWFDLTSALLSVLTNLVAKAEKSAKEEHEAAKEERLKAETERAEAQAERASKPARTRAPKKASPIKTDEN